MNLITDLQYFPPIILYGMSNKFTNIVFEQYEFFQKMSFRNRCQVAGGEGMIDLSVPLVKGRDQKTVVRDVKIAGNQDWQGQHWKTILSCYSRSPWFEYYRDDLEMLYRKPVIFLLDWNLQCFEWSCRALGIELAFSMTEGYVPNYDEEEWADWRGRLMPKNRGDFGGLRYRQVFEERTGFLPNLSILDLLFCEGRRAKELLAGWGDWDLAVKGGI